MKKFLMIAIMAIAGVAYAAAQPRAIGGNLGYDLGFSYQHSLGEKNMIDLAVDLPLFSGIGASCTYDWIDPFNAPVPWDEKGEWHWYMGVGAGAGYYGWGYKASSGFVGAVGHIGIEYDFWFPLQLSVDYRPNIGAELWKGGAAFNIWGLWSGISLGVRYKF